jgi:hypothetical protein
MSFCTPHQHAPAMPTRPNRIVQTSTEAKKFHKRHGPTLSERQQRQLERGAELDQRAARIREAEERRKAAKKKREEREEKERKARKQAGVGLATQLIGYSHTQAQLKNGMEAFLGFNKRRQVEEKKDSEISKQLETTLEAVAREPWDDDVVEEDMCLPELNTAASEHWIDDDLDDDTLLGVHDLVTSDPVEEPNGILQPSIPTPLLESPESGPSRNSPDFLRLHGPINKAIESILDKLPGSLIEVLSQDIATKSEIWDPTSSLLHKLNPAGLPPHRLRLKVGCVVTLLRNSENSSQDLQSQHLRLVRTEKDRLECLALDGQLEGTKIFLTRLSFRARHRSDDKCLYQRTQFPIRVSKDWTPQALPRETSQSTTKQPSMSRHVSEKKPPPSVTPTSKPQSNPKPSFRLPGLPASKAKSSMPPRPMSLPPCTVFDGWDDFLDSGTQIARELSQEPSSPVTPLPAPCSSLSSLVAPSLPHLSTQDFNFFSEDLEDESHHLLTAKKASPTILPTVEPRTLVEAPPKLAKKSPFPRTDHPLASKHKMAPSPPPPPQPTTKRKIADPLVVSGLPSTKRTAHAQHSHPATVHLQPSRVTVASGMDRPLQSLTEFGLSTQEAASFFDDDEDSGFGSPPIAV